MTDTMEDDSPSGIQSSSEEEEQMESLIRGRAKRSTAGRHMSALIDAAADDDLALLFEEVEDDNEFAAEAAAEAEAQEDDMGMNSSSDDDEDQGPDTHNDYEGEKELQKEERKKRRAQNDLRFQALRKRVKIDPTAVSAVSPPPRPKKKSERISWIPTPEDGPTRSSSRRQTMQNKEITHARLKDSQEKRIRIIATMKEAEKRKAHLKPKEMTQEDHLAEAERVERLNSKSLNRWEEAEKRKADERRAKIEALQNRRLEGPVMSYWSGRATWVNGRLTRVGRVDIRQKPEKDEARKKAKKVEKEEKAAVDSQGSGSAVATTLSAEQKLAAQPENAQRLSESVQTETAPLSEPSPLENKPQPGDTPAPTGAEEKKIQSEAAGGPTAADQGQPSRLDELATGDEPTTRATPVEKETSSIAESVVPKSAPQLSQKNPRPIVEVPPPREPWVSAAKASSSPKSASAAASVSEEKTDAVDIDPKPTDATTVNQKPQESLPAAGAATVPVTSGEELKKTTDERSTTAQPLEIGKPGPTVSTTGSVGSETTPQALPGEAPSHPTLSNNPAIPSQEDSPAQAPVQQAANEASAPEVPPPPPIIEHTGRNLIILENFDDKTAHSRQFNIYFNAKKPPRLTKVSSSLCVITSLPSLYRDPETSLPYANAYAYGQIRRLLSEGYIWSSMLGCFVGPAGAAARGVPERFTGGKGPEAATKTKDEAEVSGASAVSAGQDAPNSDVPPTPTPAAPPTTAGTGTDIEGTG